MISILVKNLYCLNTAKALVSFFEKQGYSVDCSITRNISNDTFDLKIKATKGVVE